MSAKKEKAAPGVVGRYENPRTARMPTKENIEICLEMRRKKGADK